MAFQLRRVLISDSVDSKCAKILEENGISVDVNTKLTKEQLIAEIKNYDGLIVRSATKVIAEVIAAADNLKIIGRAGTGVDNIDTDSASRKGIIVMNTPGGNTLSAAEHTCAFICSLSRNIPQAHMTMKEGKWERKAFMGNELYGKTLAIVGLGRIGKEVAIRMQSFGMTTIGYDPIIPAEVAREFNTEWMTLDEIWPIADYITVHTPLIPQTKGLIGEDMFSKCKKGVRILNVARGGIVDEDALLKALQSGKCGGAALDVFVEEPPKNRPLVEHPLVIATPHLGASTVEAQSRVAEEIAQQFVDVINGKSLFGAINAHAMVNALAPETKPWIKLGKSLGKLVAAISGPPTAQNTIQLNVQGSGLKNAGNYLSAAVLCGLLPSGNSLNLINAPVLSKESGIKVNVIYQESGENVCSVQMSNCLVAGTVMGSEAVLHQIEDSVFDRFVVLRDTLLFCKSTGNGKLLQTIAGLQSSSCGVISCSLSSPAKSGGVWSVTSLSSPLPSLEPLMSISSFLTQLSL